MADRPRVLATIGHGHGLARLPARKRGEAMIYSNPRDQAVDDAAVAAFAESYGERATTLPPVARTASRCSDRNRVKTETSSRR